MFPKNQERVSQAIHLFPQKHQMFPPKKYDNDFKDEYVDALMEEGELELFENKIYFGKKEVEGNPKKVCLVVSNYVD